MHTTVCLPPQPAKESAVTLRIGEPPAPPALEILTEAERAASMPFLRSQPPTVPLFRFEFRRQYSRLYANGQSFVLRHEHQDELKRIVREHHKDRLRGTESLTMSDVVNGALDFAFEHPKAFHALVRPESLRESLAREVYRSALTHFMRHEAI